METMAIKPKILKPQFKNTFWKKEGWKYILQELSIVYLDKWPRMDIFSHNWENKGILKKMEKLRCEGGSLFLLKQKHQDI